MKLNIGKLEITINKLQLVPGDTVLVKCKGRAARVSEVERIKTMVSMVLNKYRVHPVPIIILGHDVKLEALDETKMNKLGWYRKDTQVIPDESVVAPESEYISEGFDFSDSKGGTEAIRRVTMKAESEM